MTTILQIGTLFILPVLLITSGIVPVHLRFYALLVITATVLAIVRREQISQRTLGLGLDNLKDSIVPYLLFTIVVVAVTLALAKLLGKNPQTIVGNIHFQYGFLILSFLQEFLYRGFLVPKLKGLTASPVLVIIANALLFGFLHVLFPNPFSIFLLSSLLGVGFATLYYFRPNLLLITASHAVINFVAVYYCFASLSQGCPS